MTFNPNEPRDEKGKWTSGGAIGIGSDLDHPNMASLKEAVQRGVWTLRPVNVRDSWGERTTEFSIEPKTIPEGWQSGERDNGRRFWYDPTQAHMDPELQRPFANDISKSTLPIDKGEPGKLYRGMSYEEYQQALKDGHFQSTGGFNIGEAQKGLTYFSTDPHQAESYAHGFAPWMYMGVPTHPAVVVAVKDPGGEHSVDQGRPTEIGVHGQVSTDAIDKVYFGRPVTIMAGSIDVVQKEKGYGPPKEGGRMSPSIAVAWSAGEKPTVTAPEPERHEPPPPTPPTPPPPPTPTTGEPPVPYRPSTGKWTEVDRGTFTAPDRPKVVVGDNINAEKGKMVADISAEVAKALDFPLDRILVSDKDREFELNGKKLLSGGTYFPSTGMVEMRAHRLTFDMDGKTYPNRVAGVVAHEIEHAKYHALMDQVRDERQALQKDPDYGKDPSWVIRDPSNPEHADKPTTIVNGVEHIRDKGFMNPDGTLNEPWASKYPVYQRYTEVNRDGMGDSFSDGKMKRGFAYTDGVTSYSKDYWEEFLQRKGSFDLALNETLAEISRLKYEVGQKRETSKEAQAAHQANVAEIRALGGAWTAEDDKEWEKNSKHSTGYTTYRPGEVEGKKVYFAKGGRSQDRLSPEWSAMYKLVDWNWKRRNK